MGLLDMGPRRPPSLQAQFSRLPASTQHPSLTGQPQPQAGSTVHSLLAPLHSGLHPIDNLFPPWALAHRHEYDQSCGISWPSPQSHLLYKAPLVIAGVGGSAQHLSIAAPSTLLSSCLNGLHLPLVTGKDAEVVWPQQLPKSPG